MKSYRIASLLQGLAYVLVIASLVLVPPGALISVTLVSGKVVQIPQHATFFQMVAGGTGLWIALFAVGSLGLMLSALLLPRYLSGAHAFLMVVTAAFGVGYLVAQAGLGLGFLSGALSLTLCAGHALAVKARPDYDDLVYSITHDSPLPHAPEEAA